MTSPRDTRHQADSQRGRGRGYNVSTASTLAVNNYYTRGVNAVDERLLTAEPAAGRLDSATALHPHDKSSLNDS